MTRFKSLLAVAATAATLAVVPVASGQTYETNAHFIGVGSSAQWQMAAIAADQLAIDENGGSVTSGSQGTVCHWTFSSGGQVTDNRDPDGRILPQVGNVWLVWISSGANCSGSVTTNPTSGIPDVWIDVSVDSTVGVRLFSAQEDITTNTTPQTPGGQLTILEASGTAGGNLIGTCSSGADVLWPDNLCDGGAAQATLSAAALAAVNTVETNGLHINVGLTDIRPEDALYATKRALATLNTTTWAGLGYKGPTANIGAAIETEQGTGSEAVPIEFALQGKGDPFKTAYIVPPYTTIPIGAAPIVFGLNNNGAGPIVTNLVSGVTPDVHESGQTYPLANLFDGTTSCDTTNAAFGGNGSGTGQAITLFLREPLSGTMNTTEFSLFRSHGNTDDSQEKGVIDTTESPYNPLHIQCNGSDTTGTGFRERAIGTGEVVGKSGAYGLLGTPDSLGYFFYGFSNAHKLTGADFTALTLDGVDGVGPFSTPPASQEFYSCSGTTCPASLWPNNFSYPNVRNGTYKAWSIYRWLVYSNAPADAYGPAADAQYAQDYVNVDVADFVPFQACPSGDTHTICTTAVGGLGPSYNDGLSVYRSHFAQESVAANDGTLQGPIANSFPGGSTNGGSNGAETYGAGTEAGGDMGGLIEGPFGITTPNTYGYVEWFNVAKTSGACSGQTEVSWKHGAKFTAGTAWEGLTITLAGTPLTVSSCAKPTATVLYVNGTNPASIETIQVPYSIPVEITWPAATAVLSKKQ